MPRTGSKQQVGRRGEDLACAELERQGLEVVERNWRCALGEIDIVAVEGERVIGTCRLLFRAGVARLGRLAVEAERRGDGVAGAILREADTVARRAGAEAISLHAQTYAKQLYLRNGYLERGATFVEEGIEHVSMEKPL